MKIIKKLFMSFISSLPCLLVGDHIYEDEEKCYYCGKKYKRKRIGQ